MIHKHLVIRMVYTLLMINTHELSSLLLDEMIL